LLGHFGIGICEGVKTYLKFLYPSVRLKKSLHYTLSHHVCLKSQLQWCVSQTGLWNRHLPEAKRWLFVQGSPQQEWEEGSVTQAFTLLSVSVLYLRLSCQLFCPNQSCHMQKHQSEGWTSSKPSIISCCYDTLNK